jgi:mRNA-degrading endonuclease RelE of RelBE toxin-antitoxin system
MVQRTVYLDLYAHIAYSSFVARVPMTVIETEQFVEDAMTILDEPERMKLIAFLAANPEVGVLIPGSGGVRKMRWAMQGKGKRGGARVIYYYHSHRLPIFLLTLYAKTEKENLSQAERNTMKKLTKLLVEEFLARG